jgi:uncharacterized membrane protein required for colicin V production
LRFDWRGAPGEDTLPRAVSGRGAIIAVVLALWIAMTVVWGWAAGMTFGFAVAVVLVRMAGVILGGALNMAGEPFFFVDAQTRHGNVLSATLQLLSACSSQHSPQNRVILLKAFPV